MWAATVSRKHLEIADFPRGSPHRICGALMGPVNDMKATKNGPRNAVPIHMKRAARLVVNAHMITQLWIAYTSATVMGYKP